ncbi:MAG TPA: DUF4004 family protein [Alicyclobacillus sp.]|nr:DUF4004 family protein [Alicyclobacillus sp.]
MSKESLDICLNFHPGREAMSFRDILYTYVLDQLLRAGDINVSEGPVVIQTLEEHHPGFAGKPCDLVFIRKLGLHLPSHPGGRRGHFESGARSSACSISRDVSRN